jgi:hypothetical protein
LTHVQQGLNHLQRFEGALTCVSRHSLIPSISPRNLYSPP